MDQALVPTLVLLNARLAALLRSVTAADEQRRLLLSHVVRAQEAERARIAADIHDDSVQVLAAASLRLQMLAGKLTDPAQLASVEKLQATVDESLERLRHLIFEMHPPPMEEGLVAVLHRYVADTFHGLGVSWTIEDGLTAEPEPAQRTILYRIAQEALVNVLKHAFASTLTLELETEGGATVLRLYDNGVGFSPAAVRHDRPGHLGLSSLDERATMAGGTVCVESAPGAGTFVEARIPSEGPGAA